MSFTDSEVLQFVAENGVKFIRLAFCDAFGTLKNIAIMADELPRAFECGVPFDAGLVRGFAGSTPADMVLHPDASTLEVLPWRPQTGRVAASQRRRARRAEGLYLPLRRKMRILPFPSG